MSATQSIHDFSAAPILNRFSASVEMLELAKKKHNAIDLLDGLVANSDFVGAFDFLSHWMPPQFAVWWGCLCVWEIQREEQTPEFNAAMQLIVNWLHAPNEDQRQSLAQVEQWFSSRHPIGLLTKAAQMSGGSLAPKNCPAVPPPTYLFALLVSSSIKLIAMQALATGYSARCKQILRLGMEVLQGANRWERSPND